MVLEEVEDLEDEVPEAEEDEEEDEIVEDPGVILGRGRGYIRNALRTLGLRKEIACVVPSNDAVKK